jgi:hypothetical protein
MHPSHYRVRGYDKALSGLAVDERGVVDEPEPARPSERREKTPDALELSEFLGGHR